VFAVRQAVPDRISATLEQLLVTEQEG